MHLTYTINIDDFPLLLTGTDALQSTGSFRVAYSEVDMRIHVDVPSRGLLSMLMVNAFPYMSLKRL